MVVAQKHPRYATSLREIVNYKFKLCQKDVSQTAVMACQFLQKGCSSLWQVPCTPSGAYLVRCPVDTCLPYSGSGALGQSTSTEATRQP